MAAYHSANMDYMDPMDRFESQDLAVAHLRVRERDVNADSERTARDSRDDRSVVMEDDEDMSVVAQPVILRKETRRDLNWIDVACLIINKMVGTGIFTGPFSVLQATNDKRIAILLWVLGFLYTILSMGVYLEYARDLPYTGGELVYIDELFKSRRLPLLAYTLYAAYFVFLYTTSTNALIFGEQVVMATKQSYEPASVEGSQPAMRLIAIVITSVICLLLYFSSAKSQLFNRITAIAKIFLLLAVSVAGIVYAAEHTHADWTPPPNSSTTGWVQGLLTVLFSYHGWENATLVAGEIPRFKDLRNGFIGAVLVVSAFYISIAVILCYSFPWPDLNPPPNFMAVYFGGGDRAKLAASILTSLSAVGSMISVTYTSVRVKNILGWTNIFPWSSLWRMSSAVRIPWARITTMMQPPRLGQRPTTFLIPRGTPAGGVLLSWIMTTFWITISSAFHTYASAIRNLSAFLIFGHFFVSGAIGWGFLCGAFEVGCYFKHDPKRRVATPNWNSRPPWRLLFPEKRPWIGHMLLGGPLFAISIVVIIFGLTFRAGRTYFYVIVGMTLLTTIYWIFFVNTPMASKVLGCFGLSISKATHGIDDRGDSERFCDVCPTYDYNQGHRHAHDGYEHFNRFSFNNETGRFLMNIFEASGDQRYNLPAGRSASVVSLAGGAVSARPSRDEEIA